VDGGQRRARHAARLPPLLRDVDGTGGWPIERLSRYMGHSSIQVTWDNYGHLFPGDEVADGHLQEAWLARVPGAAEFPQSFQRGANSRW
jgi:hypothetical protein